MGVLEQGLWRPTKTIDQLSHEDTFSNDVVAESGRYHLYVSKACPFAHRPWLVIKLLGLDDVISVSTVASVRHGEGWEFTDESPDPILNSNDLKSLYVHSNHTYSGRVTVPILWDKKENKIVSNDSAKLAYIFATQWQHLGNNPIELVPSKLIEEIEAMNEWLHKNINRRVYQAGFATQQDVYERETQTLFESLDNLEQKLSHSNFVLGDKMTLSDLFLFPTLIRFETVYEVHFKANLRMLREYPSLYQYMQNMLSINSLRKTIDMSHILEHYYLSHRHINPSGLIPLGPRPKWLDVFDIR
ncbi:glutathione S-transferase C-terminal domain-containing protein [Vibrio tritonius]|uniref:glutathione S-transferase C-terminal domain-containing protein n=1 Tax=Vibrio tritonius TaxID=1435069 RepID=UPI00315D8441